MLHARGSISMRRIEHAGRIYCERYERKATRRVWSVEQPTMSRTGPERRQYLIRGTGRSIDQWRDRCFLRPADRSKYHGMLGRASIFHPAGGGGGGAVAATDRPDPTIDSTSWIIGGFMTIIWRTSENELPRSSRHVTRCYIRRKRYPGIEQWLILYIINENNSLFKYFRAIFVI